MQSTRLFITAQRCSSASRFNYLLKRCLTCSSAAIQINRNNSFLSLPSSSSPRDARLLSASKTLRPIRYASSGSLPSHKRITLPALSPTMETGTLRSWAKQEGEKIVEGDILAEIETDKATLGFESIDEGYLAKIIIPGGTKDIPVGKLCAIIVEKEEDIAAFKDFKGDASEPAAEAAPKPPPEEKKEKAPVKKEEATSSTSKKEQAQEKPKATTSASEGDRVAISPLAKKLAQEKGIDLGSVQGSGPNGRVVAEDVEKFIKEGGGAKAKPQAKTTKDTQAAPSKPSKKEAAAPAGGYNEQQISDLRAEYARRVTESKTTIPHYYLNTQVELDEIITSKLNEMLAPKSKDPKAKSRGLTINDFLVKAAALACKRRPETNSVWMDKSIRQYETVDINVAVATEAGVLVSPIVYNADQKGLSAISQEVAQLSEKANGGKLNGEELELGTFTIANLGMYGVTNFNAIIYPQQSAVLAIGGIETKLVPAEDSPKGFRQSTVLNVTLACDHRVIDGAVGAQWLQEFKQFLENPASMIL